MFCLQPVYHVCFHFFLNFSRIPTVTTARAASLRATLGHTIPHLKAADSPKQNQNNIQKIYLYNYTYTKQCTLFPAWDYIMRCDLILGISWGHSHIKWKPPVVLSCDLICTKSILNFHFQQFGSKWFWGKLRCCTRLETVGRHFWGQDCHLGTLSPLDVLPKPKHAQQDPFGQCIHCIRM